MKLIQTQCWGAKQVYITFPFPNGFTSPTRIPSSEFKMVDNENSNGFSKTHFHLTRSVKRTLWEFGHGARPKVRSASGFTLYMRGRGGARDTLTSPLLSSPGPWAHVHTIKLLRPLSASGWRMVSPGITMLAKNDSSQQCKIICSHLHHTLVKYKPDNKF